MENFISINKKILPEKKGLVSIKERAFRFGDGIFESCKIVNGIIYNYKSHENRIIKGLKTLEISTNISDLKQLCYNLIKKNKIKNGILRISISRGIGSEGYLPQQEIKSLIVIETILQKEQKESKNKIIIGVSKIRAPKFDSAIQKCKTMQSLHYILAKINARKSKNFDDILLNHQGFIAECSSSNIFWVKNNKIYTPSIKCNILPGTVRAKILKEYPFKIIQTQQKITTLINAEEIFLTNSNFLVLAVDELKFKNKIIKFRKDVSKKILHWINEDVEKYQHRNKRNFNQNASAKNKLD